MRKCKAIQPSLLSTAEVNGGTSSWLQTPAPAESPAHKTNKWILGTETDIMHGPLLPGLSPAWPWLRPPPPSRPWETLPQLCPHPQGLLPLHLHFIEVDQ
jgi:hypothetical protein